LKASKYKEELEQELSNIKKKNNLVVLKVISIPKVM